MGGSFLENSFCFVKIRQPIIELNEWPIISCKERKKQA